MWQELTHWHEQSDLEGGKILTGVRWDISLAGFSRAGHREGAEVASDSCHWAGLALVRVRTRVNVLMFYESGPVPG